MSAQTQPDFGATTSGGVLDVNYGLLYNHYTLADERNICAEGWHIPTIADFNTLIAAIGGAVGNAPKLKATGTVYWKTGNNGTNESGLNLRGSGQRYSGGYNSFRDSCMLWTDSMVYYGELLGTKRAMVEVMQGDDDIWVSSFVPEFTNGLAVRPLKDSTILSHGQTGTYTGNDGKVYRTICIGTQEWLADNLAETRYRNNDIITEITDNSTWAGLTTGALCAYNNDWGNV